MAVTRDLFGRTADGRAVERWSLVNPRGMRAEVLSLGGVIRSLWVPDRRGVLRDVVLGYDSVAGYERGNAHLGELVGRYANRIRGASFPLNGRKVLLEKNDGENHLHGVYGRRLWEGEAEGDGLLLRRVSPAGEEGFPGELRVEVRCTVTEENALRMEYTARVAGEDTVLNLTNHSYFNLAGAGEGDVTDHELWLRCSRFTENGPGTVPTGRILSVTDTALDFRAVRCLGSGLEKMDEALLPYGGYDHNMIFDAATAESCLGRAACARSGIAMELRTSQPAVQLYTGNYLGEDPEPGKGGVRYGRFSGFCLETQHYPASPNFPAFPDTTLRPGEVYRQWTEYRFGII